VINSQNSISKDHLLIKVILGFWVLLGFVEVGRTGAMALSGLTTFNSYRAFLFVSSYILAWVLITYPILFFFNYISKLSWVHKVLTQFPASVLFGVLHYILNTFFFELFFNQNLLWNLNGNWPIPMIPFAINSALIYWVAIFLLMVIDYYQKYREASLHSSQLEMQLAESKLQALRMQLHPHFLFNALNTIAMLVRKKQVKDATRMISGLSDMLRTALTESDRSMIPLKEELNLLKKYLEIEQIRFKDTLTINFNVDKSTLDCRVPSLILQPLVENAFKHGISRHIDDSELRISAERINGDLAISIFNTGPELPPKWNINETKGVGLTNTINRLDTLYKNNYTFEVNTKYNQGVEVRLKLPVDLV